jgi:penicillin-binding protein 1A
MTSILRGVITSGTGAAAASLSPYIAGKTGTTNNFVDALFVGYSSTVVAGAWVGLDDNRPLGNGETGGKTALPIWIDFMRVALGKYGAPPFPVPEGILNITVNRQTGRPLRAGEGEGFSETFAVGMDPSGGKGPGAPSGVDGEKPAALEDDGYFMDQ